MGEGRGLLTCVFVAGSHVIVMGAQLMLLFFSQLFVTLGTPLELCSF